MCELVRLDYLSAGMWAHLWGSGSLPHEIQNDVHNFAIVVPMRRNSQECEYVGRRPTIYTDVDAPRVCLEGWLAPKVEQKTA